MNNKPIYWKWVDGRQHGHGTDYKKFCLWSFKLFNWGFDAYILKYKPSVLHEHIDPVEGGKHWRLNIKLQGIADFGKKIDGEWKYNRKIFNFFRPDIIPHTLLIYYTGCTKLSFGFVKFKK